MSLLRQRAIETSVESTLSAFSPAEARAWFVSVTSCDSDDELKLLMSQASADRGVARIPTEVRTNATAVTMTSRRESPTKLARKDGREGRGTLGTIIGGLVSCGHRVGGSVCFRP